MSLSSSSMLLEVQAAYDDNASYAEDGSATKAKAFVTAARILLRRMPEQSGTRESTFQFRMDLIQKEMEAARTWLQANGASDAASDTSANGNVSSRIVRASFKNFRD